MKTAGRHFVTGILLDDSGLNYAVQLDDGGSVIYVDPARLELVEVPTRKWRWF